MGRRHLFLIILITVISCKGEKASYKEVYQEYQYTTGTWEGTDYEQYLSAIRESISKIDDHLLEFTESKNKKELEKYRSELKTLESAVLSEQAAHNQLISNRKDPSAVADIKKETQEINRFFVSFPKTIKKQELDNRLGELAALKGPVLIKEMNQKAEELLESMEKAARDEIPSLTRTERFNATSGQQPDITGPGEYEFTRTYQIAYSIAGMGNFEKEVKVKGIIRGDLENGAFYEVIVE